MRLVFSENAWEDYLYWQKTDKKTVERINALIREHRIVYKVADNDLLIAQLRHHY